MEEQKQENKNGNEKKLKEKISVRFVLLLAVYFVLLVGIVMLTVGYFSIGILYEYIDIPAILVQMVVLLLAMALSGAGSSFLEGWRIALGKRRDCSLTELRRCLEAMRFARSTAFLVGGTVSLVGAVDLLYQMGLSSIGPVIAFSLRTFLYAAAFALLQQPMEFRLRKRIVGYMEEGVDEEPVEDAQTIYFRLRGMGLTDREAEVARLVARELSNREIGKELFISIDTVKKHVTHILEKTGCDGRESLAELVKGRRMQGGGATTLP